MNKKRWTIILILSILAVIINACTNNEDANDDGNQTDGTNEEQNQESGQGEEAVESNATAEEEVLVSLENPEGNVVATAVLTEGADGVDIALEGENLPPGTHGFHIHEVGQCDPPDFESAGPHYNPTGAEHGFDNPKGPHAGDLENIEVAEDGTVNAEVTADMVTLEQDGENTLYTDEGTALMIHEKADDYVSQPGGDAGDRIACGVIGK